MVSAHLEDHTSAVARIAGCIQSSSDRCHGGRDSRRIEEEELNWVVGFYIRPIQARRSLTLRSDWVNNEYWRHRLRLVTGANCPFNTLLEPYQHMVEMLA